MKKLLLFAAVAMMASMASTGCKSTTEDKAAESEQTTESAVDRAEVEAPAAPAGVIDLKDDAKFRPDTKVEKTTVLDFNAVWCVPCKKLTPAFHKAADELTGVEFYSVDIDSLPQTKEAFNVQSVPTVVILTPNGEMKSYVGLTDFIKDAAVDAPDLTDIIYGNLKALIEQQVK